MTISAYPRYDSDGNIISDVVVEELNDKKVRVWRPGYPYTLLFQLENSKMKDGDINYYDLSIVDPVTEEEIFSCVTDTEELYQLFCAATRLDFKNDNSEDRKY